jgi:hypothetical protein
MLELWTNLVSNTFRKEELREENTNNTELGKAVTIT